MVSRFICLAILAVAIGCAPAVKPAAPEARYGGIIAKSTQWSGTVVIEKDTLISSGTTVSIAPGTVVLVQKADISRTEPVFLLPETEILVQGTLRIQGTVESPVVFKSFDEKSDTKSWGGVIVQGGSVEGAHLTIRNASSGISALRGSVILNNVFFTDNHIGTALFPEATGSFNNVAMKKNKTAMAVNNTHMTLSDITISDNDEGVIAQAISPFARRIKIKNNMYGMMLGKNDIEFLINDNRIYENRNNLFITDGARPLHNK